MEFAKWLNEKMEENGLTKYKVAKLAGVHQTTVSKILGGAKPQMETERKIKVALESYAKTLSPEKEAAASSKDGILGEEVLRLFFSLPPEDQAAMMAEMLRRKRG